MGFIGFGYLANTSPWQPSLSFSLPGTHLPLYSAQNHTSKKISFLQTVFLYTCPGWFDAGPVSLCVIWVLTLLTCCFTPGLQAGANQGATLQGEQPLERGKVLSDTSTTTKISVFHHLYSNTALYQLLGRKLSQDKPGKYLLLKWICI